MLQYIFWINGKLSLSEVIYVLNVSTWLIVKTVHFVYIIDFTQQQHTPDYRSHNIVKAINNKEMLLKQQSGKRNVIIWQQTYIRYQI